MARSNTLIFMHFHVVLFGNKHEISSKQHNGKVSGEFCAETVGFQEREGIINSDYYFQLQERYLRLEE